MNALTTYQNVLILMEATSAAARKAINGNGKDLKALALVRNVFNIMIVIIKTILTDVNECASGIHYCPSLNNCQNVFEGYKCTCNGNQCTGSCKYEDEYIPEGQTKSLGCDTCVCKVRYSIEF